MTIAKKIPRKPALRKPAVPRKKAVAKREHIPAVAPDKVKAESKPVEKPAVIKVPTTENFYAVGRRKTAVAQAIISTGNGTITVNELPIETYFMTRSLVEIVRQPLSAIGLEKQINVKGKAHGGGIHAQAESMRHAISRALIALNPESRRTLKKLGFLTRDPRVKERKKPGLKRARRAPQFSKR